MARRRYFARRKKVAISIAIGGVAVGLAAVFLVPILRRRYQQPTITIPENVGYRVAVAAENPATTPAKILPGDLYGRDLDWQWETPS